MLNPFKLLTSLVLIGLILSCESKPEIESLEIKEDQVIVGYVENMQRALNGNFLLVNEESQLIELNPTTGELTKHFEMTDSIRQAVWQSLVAEYDYLDFLKEGEKGYTNSFWLTNYWEEKDHKYIAFSFDFVFNGTLDSLRAQISNGFTALFDVTTEGYQFYIFDSEEYPIEFKLNLNEENKPRRKLGTLDYGFCVQNGKILTKKADYADHLLELSLSSGMNETGRLSLKKKNYWTSDDGLPGQFKRMGKEVYMTDGFQVFSLNRDFCYHLEKRNEKMYFIDYFIGEKEAKFMYFEPDSKKYTVAQTNLKGKELKKIVSVDKFGMAYCLEKDKLYYIHKDKENCYLQALDLK